MAPQKKTAGGFTVASCTTCLLVVRLQILRHPIVNNSSDVFLVNPHPKREGRDNNAYLVTQECPVDIGAVFLRHTPVVEGGPLVLRSRPRSDDGAPSRSRPGQVPRGGWLPRDPRK